MRKGRDGESGEVVVKKKKIIIMKKIVATNGVASRPPNGDRLQHRPQVTILNYEPLRKSSVF